MKSAAVVCGEMNEKFVNLLQEHMSKFVNRLLKKNCKIHNQKKKREICQLKINMKFVFGCMEKKVILQLIEKEKF